LVLDVPLIVIGIASDASPAIQINGAAHKPAAVIATVASLNDYSSFWVTHRIAELFDGIGLDPDVAKVCAYAR
jgi:hypothetical protein